ncbi:MAG: DUF2269 family protein [Anaerolineaceae bacterium]|nr:DUF2269 family protein [Anaerolineaceae bacterium]
MPYLIFKWFHVLAAIVALGSNITYGFWLSRSARSPKALIYTLQTIRAIDNKLANPGYGVLLITGIIMAYLGRWALTTSWLIVSLVLYGLTGLLGFFAFGPTLRKQIQYAETGALDSVEYRAIAQRSTLFGVVTVAVVVVIVFLMVTKPHLWG